MNELEFRKELEEAIFEVGVTGLFNLEKLAQRVKKYFEKIGKLEELREYIKE
ncbi:MAG: hypothetical protein QXR17_08670 [Candidatus Bathyarchaeia archaeon]